MVNKLLSLLLGYLLLLLLSSGSATAGTKESAAQFEKNTINHSLTLQKFRQLEQKAAADKKSLARLKKVIKQRVFWVGQVDESFSRDGYSFLLLKIDNDYVWAVADDTVRNLDFDRTGFSIGVKGTITLDRDNRLYFLDAHSLILIAAPETEGFNRFQEQKSIPMEFTFSTAEGTYKLSSAYLPFINFWIAMYNPHYSDELVSTMAKSIVFYGRLFGVDPRLMTALFTIESAMDIDAVSWSGAVGLGQLMPATAAGLGVDPDNVIENIGGATKYMKSLLNIWSEKTDQVSLSLASYNAGPGNVTRYGGIPPFSETVNYVFFINYLYRALCAQTRGLTLPDGQAQTVIEKVKPEKQGR